MGKIRKKGGKVERKEERESERCRKKGRKEGRAPERRTFTNSLRGRKVKQIL